ncbi:hypothetical protein [Pendulispora albinea]|uniref:Uncharacterized protein n=1 Tax=Pendulispora albinea TaxID=2741071 RepID=A0ABZ2M9S4_9BACT
MAEQKESSVLFSLKELMSLEEDRIRQEEAERRRQEEEAVQARLELERRAREEEEARIRAVEDERLAEEQRQREEAARLEAIRHAEIERARLEAENAARIQQMRNQQEHAERIAALSQDRSKKKLLYIAIGSGAFLVLVLIFGGMAIKSSLDKQAELEAALTAINQESESLKSKLKNATSPEERAELERQIAEKQAQMKELKDNPTAPPQTVKRGPTRPANNSNTGAGSTSPAPDKKCDCKPGDPLCTCL